MVRLLNKTIKRAACFFIAAILVFGTVFSLAGCQSDNPKATMTVAFNGRTYNLSYRLYRRFFPNTVQHFIELADAGFYDGLCFHDYQSGTGMFTGAYEYDETASGNDNTRGLVARNYFSWLEANNVSLTQSVFRYVEEGNVPTEGTNTLVGEFQSNNYTVRNNDKRFGAKKEGALVMYYTSKGSARATNVTVRRNSRREEADGLTGDARWYDSRDYAKNSATSLFYVSFTSESSVNRDYCVFAELYDEKSENEYNSLTSAIRAYIAANATEDGDSSFVEETAALPVDTEDWYYKDFNLRATYQVPVSPIVIESVKIDRR